MCVLFRDTGRETGVDSSGGEGSWLSKVLGISGRKEEKARGGLKTNECRKEDNVRRNIMCIKL